MHRGRPIIRRDPATCNQSACGARKRTAFSHSSILGRNRILRKIPPTEPKPVAVAAEPAPWRREGLAVPHPILEIPRACRTPCLDLNQDASKHSTRMKCHGKGFSYIMPRWALRFQNQSASQGRRSGKRPSLPVLWQIRNTKIITSHSSIVPLHAYLVYKPHTAHAR